MSARKDKFFQMRVDEHFLRRLDDARRAEADLPARTEMARRLIEEALGMRMRKPLSAASAKQRGYGVAQ